MAVWAITSTGLKSVIIKSLLRDDLPHLRAYTVLPTLAQKLFDFGAWPAVKSTSMSKAQHMRLVGLFTEAGELGEERDLTDSIWLSVEHEVKLGGSTSAVVSDALGEGREGRAARRAPARSRRERPLLGA